jgi:hypothetical protein
MAKLNKDMHIELQTISHPNCEELKVTIFQAMGEAKESLNGKFYCDEDGDWWDTLSEAIEDANDWLNYRYSGEYARDSAQHFAYARSERLAGA